MAAVYSLFVTRDTQGNEPIKTDGVAVTGAQTVYTEVVGPITSGFGYHFETNAASTLSGTLSFWRSNKPNADRTTDNDWVQVTTFVPVNPAGAATKSADEINFTNFRYYRFKYVNASGTGTMFGWWSTTTKA